MLCCTAKQCSEGFARSAEFVARDGEFAVGRGVAGSTGYNVTRGRPASDGTLVMSGHGSGNQARGRGHPFEIRLEGRWAGDRFVLGGSWGGRNRKIEVAQQ